ncbi:MAG: hypothetical protein A3G34_08245 [Candidatus Lindowbacteria bacterium RIFCSPLOWO2_12_FULL_62_27]|nr:MAG: hypothetical protein A3I06_14790 [Candidatus Lindowbacteria bacterium RIFCSPLOWO2_02_FULL_62_12]OGH58450.1 MAG: hypothetical protein A3G34_08245 [Candidatus Lindowbacteria bacterium RIFCSPLOWO2_12_FULL_62_27]
MKKTEILDFRFWILDLGFVVLASVAWLLAPGFQKGANAQMSAEELRREQIETIEALKRTEDISGGSSRMFGDLGRKTGWIFTYGSPMSVQNTWGDNGSDRNSSEADAQDHSWDYEVKPFLNVKMEKKAKFYTRLTTKYTETKKNAAATRGNNYIQPTIDMAYYEKEFTGTKAGGKRKLTVGRQFTQVGRGIAFALTADGVLWESTKVGKAGKGEYKMFALRQNPGDDNIDATASGSGRTKRQFYGIHGKYDVHPKAKMSFYYVQVSERNKNLSASTPEQKHGLEPKYFGWVSEGRVTKDLQYWAEYIVERGHTYDSSVGGVGSKIVGINARALITGMKYYFSGDLKPNMFFELVTATGDEDATSTNSPQGGSSSGNDSRFNPFGGASLGLAMSPTMTNMTVYKFGASIKPFARSPNKSVQEFSIAPEYYVFRRWTGSKGAAGNDSKIDYQSSNRIGDEVDVNFNWRQFSDVTYQLKYGYFHPGSAYLTTKNAETYWRFKVSVEL